ncbi:hypothetical protein BJY52DRAFT_1183824 [Lactarius psammicola]|nr:hypothetical protein BJY52DRAFT_1183824 [Lactarius psammicola]
MAPRIVSWSDNEICISPVLSSAASIVSFDSTFSDTYPGHSQMSPTASEAPGLPSTEFRAKHTSLPGFSEEGKMSRGVRATPDDSFIRHDAYFFKDGNVTFLIDGTLYCVHRYFFSRDSVYFSTRFAQLDIHDHEALPAIISISDIERKDFEALLSILYPANFEAHELTYEQWKSVLRLSTRWGFASLRKLALKSITPPTAHDQFVLARTYSVDHWVLPALTALCERTLPLSLDEARQMSMEDVILVATVREEIRGSALRVDAADIRRHVEVAQAGKLDHPAGKDVFRDRPKSGSTGQESDSTVASGVGPNVEVMIAKTMRVGSPSGPQQGAAKEGDTHESDVGRSSKEVPVESPGVEQPHIVEGSPQDCLKKSVATSAGQTRGPRKLEDVSPEATARPLAEAVFAENYVVGAMARQEAEPNAKAETMCRLVGPEVEAAKECADAKEQARKAQEEAAHANEKAYAEARKAAAEARKAEAKTKRGARARAKVEAAAKAKAELDAKVAEEAKVEAAEGALAAAARAESEAKQKAETERLEIEAEIRSETAKTKAEAEEEWKRVVEMAELRAEQAEEQIARQRAADKAARAAANASTSSSMSPAWGSGGGSWFSKFQAASVVASAIPTEEPAPPKSTSPL